MYDGYCEKLAAALRLRPCRGYHVPSMVVVPPGLDFSNLKVSGLESVQFTLHNTFCISIVLKASPLDPPSGQIATGSLGGPPGGACHHSA